MAPQNEVPAPDETLMALARAGDHGAFNALMTRHQSRVYRLAMRLTGDVQQAEDIVQDTFLQVYRKRDTYRGESQFSTWLYRIAMNTGLMSLRSRRSARTESLDGYLSHFDEQGCHARLDVDYSAAARVEQTIEQLQLVNRVREALVELPEVYRAAFVLYDLEELSSAEVAEILSVDAAAVRQRVHRARLMLRGMLGHLAGSEKS